MKKLKLAKEELKHIYDEQVFITRLAPPKNFFEKITQGATKIWSAFDMGVRIVEAVYDKISKYIDALSAKQEATTGLQAMTGLSDADIEWLTRQAERIATTMDERGLRVTQSSREILEAIVNAKLSHSCYAWQYPAMLSQTSTSTTRMTSSSTTIHRAAGEGSSLVSIISSATL